MLSVSYAVAAAAICGAALYLVLNLRLFLTTTTMLLGSLLLIYGPAFLTYTLSSGETDFLLQRLSGTTGLPHPIYPMIQAKVPDFDAIIIAMNFSIALMYAGIIAGIEAVDRLFPKRTAMLRPALTNWSTQPLHDDIGRHRMLLMVILALVLLMSYFSITENHIATIWNFLSIKGDEDVVRNAFRFSHGGSPDYLYRLILGAVAPMFVIWGLLAGWSGRSWRLLSAASLLLIVTLIGKSETLSKAPPAFFLVQLMLAAFLAFSNKVTWRSALGAAGGVALTLFAVTVLVVRSAQGMDALRFMYSRVFEAPNQALLEYYGTFPFVHPFMWGASIRPVATLMGQPYLPAYSIVAFAWYGTYDVTSNALFIADAWADFWYVGVIAFSLVAGAVCRSIDAVFLADGKTVTAIAVLGAAFFGVFTLLVTALNTAMASGGLLLAPILAGLVVVASRYFGWRRPASPARHAASSK